MNTKVKTTSVSRQLVDLVKLTHREMYLILKLIDDKPTSDSEEKDIAKMRAKIEARYRNLGK